MLHLTPVWYHQHQNATTLWYGHRISTTIFPNTIFHDSSMTFPILHDFSLTSLKFSDIFSFSRQVSVVTLYNDLHLTCRHSVMTEVTWPINGARHGWWPVWSELCAVYVASAERDDAVCVARWKGSSVKMWNVRWSHTQLHCRPSLSWTCNTQTLTTHTDQWQWPFILTSENDQWHWQLIDTQLV